MTRYRWVAARKAEGFPTAMSCDAAGVSRQAFYDWWLRRAAGPSAAELAEAELVGAIKQVHAASGGAYGSPRVTAQLRRQGRRVNHKRVERLMREHGICGIHKRRKPRWSRSAGVRPAPADLVRRDFRPGAPDRVWAGDITYIPTGQGWLHLAAVIDVGSRKLIGYSMAPDMPARLVVDALHTAASLDPLLAAGEPSSTSRLRCYDDRLNPANTYRGKTPRRWPATRCANPSDGSATAGTKASSSRSSHPREQNSSPRPASRPETRPASTSLRGSAAGTTNTASTPPSAWSHQ